MLLEISRNLFLQFVEWNDGTAEVDFTSPLYTSYQMSMDRYPILRLKFLSQFKDVSQLGLIRRQAFLTLAVVSENTDRYREG